MEKIKGFAHDVGSSTFLPPLALVSEVVAFDHFHYETLRLCRDVLTAKGPMEMISADRDHLEKQLSVMLDNVAVRNVVSR